MHHETTTNWQELCIHDNLCDFVSIIKECEGVGFLQPTHQFPVCTFQDVLMTEMDAIGPCFNHLTLALVNVVKGVQLAPTHFCNNSQVERSQTVITSRLN